MHLLQTDLGNKLAHSSLASPLSHTLRSHMFPAKLDNSKIQTNPFCYNDMQRVLDKRINELICV